VDCIQSSGWHRRRRPRGHLGGHDLRGGEASDGRRMPRGRLDGLHGGGASSARFESGDATSCKLAILVAALRTIWWGCADVGENRVGLSWRMMAATGAYVVTLSKVLSMHLSHPLSGCSRGKP
jgi:hypothetical protein